MAFEGSKMQRQFYIMQRPVVHTQEEFESIPKNNATAAQTFNDAAPSSSFDLIQKQQQATIEIYLKGFQQPTSATVEVKLQHGEVDISDQVGFATRFSTSAAPIPTTATKHQNQQLQRLLHRFNFNSLAFG